MSAFVPEQITLTSGSRLVTLHRTPILRVYLVSEYDRETIRSALSGHRKLIVWNASTPRGGGPVVIASLPVVNIAEIQLCSWIMCIMREGDGRMVPIGIEFADYRKPEVMRPIDYAARTLESDLATVLSKALEELSEQS